MTPTRSQAVMIIIAFAIILVLALVFLGIIPGLRGQGPEAVVGELLIWGIDDKAVFNDTIISPYNASFPGVEIRYEQFSLSNYEDQLINALAAGRGPDLLMVHRSWLPKHADKLAFLTEEQYALATLRNDFPEVVSTDFYRPGGTFAFPLYLDTLSLFYNRDIFSNAGIAKAPQTWEELDEIIPRLLEADEAGRITQAAIALGGSTKSIANAADILGLFFLQDGVQMTQERSEETEAVFARSGEASFRRYLNYANPAEPNYTWNDDLGDSINNFASEDVAMIVDYGSQENSLQKKNAFLNFSVSALPQKAGEERAVNYADYWGLAVSATSVNRSLAWDFIGTTLLNSETMSAYSEATGKPAALSSLVAAYASNPSTSFLSKQILTAKSWLQPDENFVRDSFSKAIRSVLTAQASPSTALQTSESEISQVLAN